MKGLIKIVIVFNLLLVLSTCSDPLVKSVPNRQKCFLVVDKNNGNVIDGVYMELFVRQQPSRVSKSYRGHTDANGECCFIYKETSQLISLYVDKEGYVRKCSLQDYSRIIELTPVAILKLHIQDEAPPSNYSILYISVVRAASHCGGSWNKLWEDDETNMDIIENISLAPGWGSVSWSWWHNDISYESDKHMLDLTSGDTTYFDIIY